MVKLCTGNEQKYLKYWAQIAWDETRYLALENLEITSMYFVLLNFPSKTAPSAI